VQCNDKSEVEGRRWGQGSAKKADETSVNILNATFKTSGRENMNSIST
jgi:hypothetical protein